MVTRRQFLGYAAAIAAQAAVPALAQSRKDLRRENRDLAEQLEKKLHDLIRILDGPVAVDEIRDTPSGTYSLSLRGTDFGQWESRSVMWKNEGGLFVKVDSSGDRAYRSILISNAKVGERVYEFLDRLTDGGVDEVKGFTREGESFVQVEVPELEGLRAYNDALSGVNQGVEELLALYK